MELWIIRGNCMNARGVGRVEEELGVGGTSGTGHVYEQGAVAGGPTGGSAHDRGRHTEASQDWGSPASDIDIGTEGVGVAGKGKKMKIRERGTGTLKGVNRAGGKKQGGGA